MDGVPVPGVGGGGAGGGQGGGPGSGGRPGGRGSSVRGAIKEAHPDFSLGDIGREIGKRWRELDEAGKGTHFPLRHDADVVQVGLFPRAALVLAPPRLRLARPPLLSAGRVPRVVGARRVAQVLSDDDDTAEITIQLLDLVSFDTDSIML